MLRQGSYQGSFNFFLDSSTSLSSIDLAYNRLGTMADLAIIFRSSYNSHFQQSKRVQKMNFQRICYKNCRVAFRLVLQFTANHLGSRKGANIHSHRLLVFAPTVFLFWSCNSVRIHVIYTRLTKSVFTAYIGLSLVIIFLK